LKERGKRGRKRDRKKNRKKEKEKSLENGREGWRWTGLFSEGYLEGFGWDVDKDIPINWN
jgi:hypothetical protein